MLTIADCSNHPAPCLARLGLDDHPQGLTRLVIGRGVSHGSLVVIEHPAFDGICHYSLTNHKMYIGDSENDQE